jgi:hypothetical protein
MTIEWKFSDWADERGLNGYRFFKPEGFFDLKYIRRDLS